MFHKRTILLAIFVIETCLSTSLDCLATPVDDWQKLINEGSTEKFNGQYKPAIESFSTAVSLANQSKLSTNCLAISLCRLADTEVTTNQISQADIHFQKIIDIYKQQKKAGTLNPKLSFWMAALSESYISNTKPETREKCLKRACYLKDIIYGTEHKECIDCLNKLAEYYFQNNHVDKGIHMLRLTQALLDEHYKKNPNALSRTLSDLAIKYRKDHKYQEAKKLALSAIESINSNAVDFGSDRVTLYCLAAINAFAEHEDTLGTEYFNKAKKICLTIPGKKNRDLIRRHLGSLNDFILKDIYRDKQLSIAEKETRELIAVYTALHSSPVEYYGITGMLGNVLQEEHKYPDLIKLLQQQANDTSNPRTAFHDNLPNVYMNIATAQASSNPPQMKKANQSFKKAISCEKDSKGPHATLILFWWGYYLQLNHDIPMALEVLTTACTQAQRLPIKERGSLLADALRLIGIIEWTSGNKIHAQMLMRQSAKEFQHQKKLTAPLWPNIYNR